MGVPLTLEAILVAIAEASHLMFLMLHCLILMSKFINDVDDIDLAVTRNLAIQIGLYNGATGIVVGYSSTKLPIVFVRQNVLMKYD